MSSSSPAPFPTTPTPSEEARLQDLSQEWNIPIEAFRIAYGMKEKEYDTALKHLDVYDAAGETDRKEQYFWVALDLVKNFDDAERFYRWYATDKTDPDHKALEKTLELITKSEELGGKVEKFKQIERIGEVLRRLIDKSAKESIQADKELDIIIEKSKKLFSKDKRQHREFCG